MSIDICPDNYWVQGVRTGHRDAVWQSRLPEDVSCFQTEPAVSPRMIRAVSKAGDGIIDIGGGAWRPIDHLSKAQATRAAASESSCTASSGER
jgi:hypothetical protein